MQRGYSRGDCHPSGPLLIRGAFYTPQKPGENPRHSPSPRQAFTHCGGFAPGASRRTSALVSVPIWGLPLSRPLPVLGLAGRYPANYLIGRRPPLGRNWEGLSQFPFGNGGIPHPISYGELPSVSRGYSPPEKELSTCYSAVRRDTLPGIPSLPWVSRKGIAMAPRRINGNSADFRRGPSPKSTAADSAAIIPFQIFSTYVPCTSYTI